MKKYILLIISLLISIFMLLNNWFLVELMDMLTPFLYPIFIFFPLFISYIICLTFSINSLVKKHSTVLDYLPTVILGLTVILVLFFPFRTVKMKLELSLYEDARNTVIQMIENKELIADNLNNVSLPKQYKKVSVSGEATLYQNDEEGTVIGFWVFRGMQSGSIQVIYSTGGEQLIRNNETGHPIVCIEPLKDKWYYVETDY